MDLLTLASVFLTQVGARHLIFEFTDAQKKALTHPLTQAMILFGMFFFSTRSVGIATLLVASFYLALLVFFNENHPLNLFSTTWINAGAKKADIYYENVSRLG